jgi:hypothetical protein
MAAGATTAIFSGSNMASSGNLGIFSRLWAAASAGVKPTVMAAAAALASPIRSLSGSPVRSVSASPSDGAVLPAEPTTAEPRDLGGGSDATTSAVLE